jgi:hypothetical protein
VQQRNAIARSRSAIDAPPGAVVPSAKAVATDEHVLDCLPTGADTGAFGIRPRADFGRGAERMRFNECGHLIGEVAFLDTLADERVRLRLRVEVENERLALRSRVRIPPPLLQNPSLQAGFALLGGGGGLARAAIGQQFVGYGEYHDERRE